MRSPKFSEEVPALLDDVVGFIAKYIAKYCDGMSVVIWSDHRCDGVIFHGHPNYRSGEAWNDWGMIKWQTTETGNDGLSIDIETHFEGQIYGFVDLHDTCVLDFHFHGDRLLPVLQEGGPAICHYSFCDGSIQGNIQPLCCEKGHAGNGLQWKKKILFG